MHREVTAALAKAVAEAKKPLRELEGRLAARKYFQGSKLEAFDRDTKLLEQKLPEMKAAFDAKIGQLKRQEHALDALATKPPSRRRSYDKRRPKTTRSETSGKRPASTGRRQFDGFRSGQACGSSACVYRPAPTCLMPAYARDRVVLKCVRHGKSWGLYDSEKKISAFDKEMKVAAYIRANWPKVSALPIQTFLLVALGPCERFAAPLDVPANCMGKGRHAYYDYVGSETLESRMQRWADQTARHKHEYVYWAAVWYRVLLALTYMHGLDVVHDDFHSKNIVLGDRDGMPRVIDFERANVRGYHDPQPSSMVYPSDLHELLSLVKETLNGSKDADIKALLSNLKRAWPSKFHTDEGLDAGPAVALLERFLNSQGGARWIVHDPLRPAQLNTDNTDSDSDA